MSLITIESVKGVEWEAEYAWDVRFMQAPAPFNNFFPAVSLEENLYTVEQYEIEVGIDTFSVPKSSREVDIRVSFLDNEEGLLKNWFTDWVNITIFSKGRVAPLSSCVRTLEVMKNTRYGTIAKHSFYRVYPKGELSYSGTSESGAPVYTVELAIVESRHSALV